jgi:quercetin dioxygenase-like cupin family protein
MGDAPPGYWARGCRRPTWRAVVLCMSPWVVACTGSRPAAHLEATGGPVDVVWTPEEEAQARAVRPYAKTESASYAFVRMQAGEALHRHDKSDLTMVMLRGHARVRIGARDVELWPGDVAQIPRGTPHAVANLSPEPIVGFAVFSPPGDPKDRVELE